MAKSSTKKGSRSNKSTVDKITKAAMSREMMAAGLTAGCGGDRGEPRRRAARSAM